MIGIFNGAKGKVVAFAFSYDPDDIGMHQQNSNVQNELSVVFVQMDNDVGYSIILSFLRYYHWIYTTRPTSLILSMRYRMTMWVSTDTDSRVTMRRGTI